MYKLEWDEEEHGYWFIDGTDEYFAFVVCDKENNDLDIILSHLNR